MMELFIEGASSYSHWIDNQILFITILVGFWFLLAEFFLFWLIFRYRARDGVKAEYVTGKEKQPKKLITISHFLILFCDVLIIIGAIKVWVDIKMVLPEPDAEVRVIGQQWTWTFGHPGPDGVLDTADDIATTDELHVQVGKTYHFKLESEDVLHCFSVPVFRLKQDAIPGRTITGWFKPTKTGTFDIQCAEMCGIGHGVMAGRIIIESAEQHASWNENHNTMVAVEATID